ncbi:MAG: hypothetical protein ACR2OU_16500 [Thermomicrobiales bacterium]
MAGSHARPAAGGPSSAAAVSYLLKSVSARTDASYRTAVKAFREWRKERGTLPDVPLAADEMCSWAAELCDRGEHTAGTIRSYCSALGSWFRRTQQHPDSFAPNPGASEQLKGVLDGIERELAERAQERPLSSTVNKSQPLLYTTMLKLPFQQQLERDRMLRAAGLLGVAAALRPGELLPSNKSRERTLVREQLRFFADAAGTVPMAPSATGEQPRVMELHLRITKTEQLHGTVKVITAAEAVAAVWNWWCETAPRGPRGPLFQLGGHPRHLSSYALAKDLERRHARAGLGEIRLTGKSLRRGGASTLSMQGYEGADIAALGWAPNSDVWQRYANDPLVQRQRSIARANLMDTPGLQRDSSSSGGAAAAAAAFRPTPRR